MEIGRIVMFPCIGSTGHAVLVAVVGVAVGLGFVGLAFS